MSEHGPESSGISGVNTNAHLREYINVDKSATIPCSHSSSPSFPFTPSTSLASSLSFPSSLSSPPSSLCALQAVGDVYCAKGWGRDMGREKGEGGREWIGGNGMEGGGGSQRKSSRWEW